MPWLRGGSFKSKSIGSTKIDHTNTNYFNTLTGAANRTRTCDPVITNDVLYQLSYCGGPCAFGSFRKRPHLISGAPRFCKKNGALQQEN